MTEQTEQNQALSAEELATVLKWLDARIPELAGYENNYRLTILNRIGVEYTLKLIQAWRTGLQADLEALQQRAGGGGE